MATLYGFYVLALVVYLIGVRLVLWRWMDDVHRRVFVLLNAVTFPVYALYILKISTGVGDVPFWNWFLDVNEEFGLMATFSATLLMVTGGAALVIALTVQANLWQRLFWLINSAVFIFLALDEYYLIHETVHALVGVWQLLYLGFGATVVILGAVLWRLGRRYDRRLFVLYLIGLGVLGGSGIALDYVFQEIACRNPSLGGICADLNLIEEIMETLGACFVLALFVRIAAEDFSGAGSRRFVAALGMIAGAWLLWAVGYWWLLPSVELRFAERVNVQFDDGRMSLVGYRIPDRSPAPGETLHLTTYWRANEPVTRMYQVSAHLLTQDYDSIAQDDPDAAWFPSYAWLPGLTVRQNLNIPIPDDAETPYGYALGVSLWDFRQPEREITVSGDLPRLFGETVTPGYITVMAANAAQSTAPDSGQYAFANEITLRGYELPERASPGDTITLRFWWEAGSEPVPDQRQFLHFLPETGDDDDYFIFDQVPYSGKLPTASWVEGLTFVDEWQITIPDSVSPGTYEVISGLFNAISGERLPASGISGAPVRDGSMVLGEIVLE